MSWIMQWILSGLRLSLPLIFASYGGLLSERAGVANIALEAYLLVSAFTAASVMALTHSLIISVGAALFATTLLATVFCFFTLYARADQIIVGMALNIFVSGFIPVMSKALFDVSGNTPSLNADERFFSTLVFFLLAFLAFIFVQMLFSKTVFGLRVWAAGENPASLRTQGVHVGFTRFKAIILGSLIASLGGIYLSSVAAGYTRNISAGRGYIALAALIFGRWKPFPTLMGCLLFGLTDSLQILLQGVPLLPSGAPLPTQFVQALPYIVTLLLLAGVAGKVAAPKAINQREE